MRAPRTLTAAALAALVALASLTVQASPVSAADPSPAPVAATHTDPEPSANPAPVAALAPSAAPAVALVEAVVAPAPAPPTRAQVLAGRLQLVARIAISKIRGRYVFGAMGPYAFDCSGLVRYAYNKAGMSSRLGGGHSASAMLFWGRIHHLTSTRNPQVGDVAVWGNGSHVGIYIGGGRVISALNPRAGIKITGVHALTTAFTAYIHTGR